LSENHLQAKEQAWQEQLLALKQMVAMIKDNTYQSLFSTPDHLPVLLKNMIKLENIPPAIKQLAAKIISKHKTLATQTGNLNFQQACLSTEEKMKVLREYREKQYESLIDAVYKRRGWNNNGVPKIEFLKKIGMDFPEVIEVVKNFQ